MLSKKELQQKCLFIAFELDEMNKSDKMYSYLLHELNTFIYVLGDDIPCEWYEMSVFIKLCVFDF